MPAFEDEHDVYRHGDCQYSIETLGLFVSSRKKDAPFNVPRARESIETFPVYGRYAHELDHLYRGVGSSWGLACHCLLGRALTYYLRILSEFNLEFDLQGIRLKELVQQLRWNVPAVQEVGIKKDLITGIRSIAHAYELRRTLLGFRPKCQQGVIAESAERILGCTLVDNQATDFCFHELRTKEGAVLKLSAQTIIEALAILKESIFAVDNREAKDSETLILAERSNSEYVLALDIGRSKLQHLFDWEYQPIELEAALNLALWSPISPADTNGFSPFNWNDIEVGHRYLRILDWIETQSKPLTSHSSLDALGRDAICRKFFDNASRDLGWPSPFSLAQVWQSHLQKSLPWAQTDFYWWCFGEKRLRTSFALHLLSEFQEHPYYCWFISNKLPALDRPTFTYVQYEDTLELFSQHMDAVNKNISARIESYIFAGMQIFLGLKSVASTDDPIISNHLAIVPKFFTGLPETHLVSRNLEYLVDQMKQ